MQPKLEIISAEIIHRIVDEALQLLAGHGVKLQLKEGRDLLAEYGASIDEDREVVFIPEVLTQKALETVPREFFLYDQIGNQCIRYGGDEVHFDPGSSGVNILDLKSNKHRPATTQDLVNIIKIAESLPQYDAQSTSVVCSEIPKEIGDLYRLYLVLILSVKPVVTGAFSINNTSIMMDMLSVFAGDRKSLAQKPTAVFDVCPSPPLIWSEFGAKNLIDLARAGVPAQIVSMPLAGAAAPITLLGSVVQHAAECLSGITIHQLANPGAPIVWGGAPAIMDMRHGTTPMGAIETAMIDIAYTQVGKHFNLPTHTYLGASDAKSIDYQAGMESSTTAMVGALAGINMISGAGMLDFLASMSLEKLVLDAEAIRMAKRMLAGMLVHTDTLALELFDGIDFKGDFLKQGITRKLFQKEQFTPSDVIDRASIRAWEVQGGKDSLLRASSRVRSLIDSYQYPEINTFQIAELKKMVESLGKKVGLEKLPEFF
jgi:trimethylamine--corrinoid protein Co-methyltransferase